MVLYLVFFVGQTLLNSGLTQVERLDLDLGSEAVVDEYFLKAKLLLDDVAVIARVARAEVELDSGLVEEFSSSAFLLQDSARSVVYSFHIGNTVQGQADYRTEILQIGSKSRYRGSRPSDAHPSTVYDFAKLDGKSAEQISKSGIFLLPTHTRYDPYGLPFAAIGNCRGKLTSLDSLAKLMMLDTKLLNEVRLEHRLEAKYTKNGFLRDLTFDERQGGMPTQMVDYLPFDKNRGGKDYYSRTNTVWKEVPGTDTWLPQRVVVLSENRKREETVEIDFVWPTVKELEKLHEIQWEKIADDSSAEWWQLVKASLTQSVPTQ